MGVYFEMSSKHMSTTTLAGPRKSAVNTTSTCAYPSMRVAGDGFLTPQSLRGSSVTADADLAEGEPFGVNQHLPRWDDELVFFQIRRTSRLPKVLARLSLRAPTYHHAIALAQCALDAPIEGEIIVAHSPIGTRNKTVSRLAVRIESGEAHLFSVPLGTVFPSPVWAVGVR